MQGLDITLFHSGFGLLVVVAVLLQTDDVRLLLYLLHLLFSRLGSLAGKDLQEVCFLIYVQRLNIGKNTSPLIFHWMSLLLSISSPKRLTNTSSFSVSNSQTWFSRTIFKLKKGPFLVILPVPPSYSLSFSFSGLRSTIFWIRTTRSGTTSLEGTLLKQAGIHLEGSMDLIQRGLRMMFSQRMVLLLIQEQLLSNSKMQSPLRAAMMLLVNQPDFFTCSISKRSLVLSLSISPAQQSRMVMSRATTSILKQKREQSSKTQKHRLALQPLSTTKTSVISRGLKGFTVSFWYPTKLLSFTLAVMSRTHGDLSAKKSANLFFPSLRMMRKKRMNSSASEKRVDSSSLLQACTKSSGAVCFLSWWKAQKQRKEISIKRRSCDGFKSIPISPLNKIRIRLPYAGLLRMKNSRERFLYRHSKVWWSFLSSGGSISLGRRMLQATLGSATLRKERISSPPIFYTLYFSASLMLELELSTLVRLRSSLSKSGVMKLIQQINCSREANEVTSPP